MMGGFWLIENTTPILAVGPLSAGLFLLMHGVADVLVPGASSRARGYLKVWTAMVFLEWTPVAVWLIWTGKPL